MLYALRQPIYAIFVNDVLEAVKKLGHGWEVRTGITHDFLAHTSGLRALKGEWVVVSPITMVLTNTEFQETYIAYGECHG